MKHPRLLPALYALLAAVFYALNMPFSRMLLQKVHPAMLASLLYLGAGLGIGLLFLYRHVLKRPMPGERLTQADWPAVLGMVVLDIIAPILLMLGLRSTPSATASLLNNFEIVATSLIALGVFKEQISKRLWLAILLITLSSILLSLEEPAGLRLSPGALLVLVAASCWGLENNLTRRLSNKNTFVVVTIKGIFSGLGALVVAMLMKAPLPVLSYAALALLLGFVAYGLSIFLYIRAQRDLGAAKTSAYYAAAPFVGALLSFIVLGEGLSPLYLPALALMLVGSAFLVFDTLRTDNN